MVRFVKLSDNNLKCIYEFYTSLGESGKLEVSYLESKVIEAVDFHNKTLDKERIEQIAYYAKKLIELTFPESYTYATH